MRNKSTISTLLPFQGVNGFTNDNPPQGAASLALGAPLGFQPAQGAASLTLLYATLGFQPALGKVKSVVHLNSNPQKESLDFQA